MLDLVKDEKYGITGQFANLHKIYVTSIKKEHAKELVNIFSSSLHFTEDACESILSLSHCRPYIIQIICRNCAIYAIHEKRNILGTPEVEKVVRILTCEEEALIPDINHLEQTSFDNNLIFSKERNGEFFDAITSILAIKGHHETSFLPYDEIKSIWKNHRLNEKELAGSLDDLEARHVITHSEDEGVSGYCLQVGIFRRWWKVNHPNLQKELDSIQRQRG